MRHPRLISEKINKLRDIDNIKGTDSMPRTTQNIRILTIQEVARLLRIHRSTVSRYATSGELKSYVVGNRRLFKETDVWTFFENRVADEYVFGKENV
jgi:excisionase family DNA binding protein